MGELLTQVALIAYLLLIEYKVYNNYDKLYRSFFRIMDSHHEPYGKWQFIVFFILGILLSLSSFIDNVATSDKTVYNSAIIVIAFTVMLYSLGECIFRFKSFKAADGRCTFLLILCLFSATGGFFILLLGILALIAVFVFLLIRVGLSVNLNSEKSKTQSGGCKYRKDGWCTQIRNSGNRCPYHGGFENCEYIHY